MTTNGFYPRCHPTDPMRQPAWRWSLAAMLVERYGHPAPGWGAHVSEPVLEYLIALRGGAAEDQLAREYRLITQALTIWNAGGWDRAILECRFLSGASTGSIARATGMDRDLVQLYGKVFFHVRPRLGHSAFVRHIAIGPQMYCDPRDLATTFRLFSYALGRHVLNAMLWTYRDTIRPTIILDRSLTRPIDPDTELAVRLAVEERMTPGADCRYSRIAIRLVAAGVEVVPFHCEITASELSRLVLPADAVDEGQLLEGVPTIGMADWGSQDAPESLGAANHEEISVA